MTHAPSRMQIVLGVGVNPAHVGWRNNYLIKLPNTIEIVKLQLTYTCFLGQLGQIALISKGASAKQLHVCVVRSDSRCFRSQLIKQFLHKPHVCRTKPEWWSAWKEG